MPVRKTRKHHLRRRRHTRRRGHRGGGDLKDTFVRLTGADTPAKIEKWFQKNAEREAKDLEGSTDLEVYITGMRPINFVVRNKTTKATEIVGFVAD